MGETTDQIERHINDTRNNLTSNLNELEHKVMAVADWRQQFQTNPMTMLGAAFGGGIALASILGNGKSCAPKTSSFAPQADVYTTKSSNTSAAMETWDNVKGALMTVAASRFAEFVNELVPGFKEQFQRTGTGAKPVNQSPIQ